VTTRPSSLEATRDRLLAAFADAGHAIRSPVRIEARRDLAASATTIRSDDGFAILVSDRAAERGPLAMLLAHELGHVQRMDAGHPSHDDDAITAAYAAVPPRSRERPYQRAILHRVINFTQDLYADPVSFRVASRAGLVEPARLDELVAGFVNDEPYSFEDPREARWDQTEDMVGNARARTLARLVGASRALESATRAQERYLSRIPPDVAREAGWFQSLFDDLPEETTRERFTSTLVEYVTRFVATAEG